MSIRSSRARANLDVGSQVTLVPPNNGMANGPPAIWGHAPLPQRSGAYWSDGREPAISVDVVIEDRRGSDAITLEVVVMEDNSANPTTVLAADMTSAQPGSRFTYTVDINTARTLANLQTQGMLGLKLTFAEPSDGLALAAWLSTVTA